MKTQSTIVIKRKNYIVVLNTCFLDIIYTLVSHGPNCCIVVRSLHVIDTAVSNAPIFRTAVSSEDIIDMAISSALIFGTYFCTYK